MTISKEQQPKSLIPLPNLHNPDLFNSWLDSYIHTPFPGYEDLKHADGTLYTEEERIQATRKQYLKLAQDYREDQEMLGEISDKLMNRASQKIPVKI